MITPLGVISGFCPSPVFKFIYASSSLLFPHCIAGTFNCLESGWKIFFIREVAGWTALGHRTSCTAEEVIRHLIYLSFKVVMGCCCDKDLYLTLSRYV